MERYYEIWVASLKYHGFGALTYSATNSLAIGSIVRVPLRGESVLGLVYKKVSKPAFKTRPIIAKVTETKLPLPSLGLINWMSEYYPAPIGSIIQQFLPKSLTTKNFSTAQPTTVNTIPRPASNLPALSDEQKKIMGRLVSPTSYLLHGITGSGKTRVYLELAQQVLSQGKSVIVLTPEISLTTQLSKTFEQLFQSQVVVVHSHLTDKQRRDNWVRMLSADKPLVVIGARSALFSPLQHIGLIVVDEAHEAAYKQEQAPYYHAIRVASKLAELHHAYLILGSATPSVTDYFIAEHKKTPILKMEHLATLHSKEVTSIETIDIKDRHNFSSSYTLSKSLIEAMTEALNKKEQTLLFLNRRGTARTIICQQCGWQAICPNCDIPLIYHGDSYTMRCHTCNYHQVAVSACPVCGNSEILFKTIGTKAVVDEVQRLFPEARIQRFDNDNLKSERFETHYENVLSGGVDIIVGTQTLAKGLDLPALSVVGVIAADTNLYSPEYTSQERMYQLISQVIGRIGRGHRAGKAIIQTYSPDNKILRAAVERDWKTFYEFELSERQQFMFPPFCYILKLYCRRANSSGAEKAAYGLLEFLRTKPLQIQINGPAPAFHEKKANRFEWQLIIKSKRRSELLKVIALLPSGWLYDIDPVSLL